MIQSATASAPASIGNVSVGFDVLGQAFDAVRDTVTAERMGKRGVALGAVSGLVDTLPDQPEANTALAAAQAVLRAARAPFGVTISIRKGVPVSAGMGGSAASAVAAAAAVNALLDAPFGTDQLLAFALKGEAVSADPPPWDNVMASLHGGLVIAARLEPALVRRMPAPKGVTAVLLHPDARIETRAARGILKPSVPLHTAVEHARRISAFTLGCATNDPELIRAGFEDILIEPQRRYLLPELPHVKKAAIEAGALGCSFSGSGPSVFAWALDGDVAAVEAAMAGAFKRAGRKADTYRAPLDSAGVRVEQAVEAAA
ncbi:homoserine kinase [Alkalicaulis satelles]|uniref:Homoserine kinase n=1 Tax=Alkalicaulis satelles TaxID=2609175 RepID=A0A5M6Z9J3_9PROT|nr:homoserine kinase [Alkalicaulis satelles]KAA5801005.1 homoserine kinase [Alkalicaulis satelles]